MIGKHLLLTIRGLRKNLLYAIFVIAGLAIGITTFLATIQWSAWHLSYDKDYADTESIYRLTFEENNDGFYRHTARILHGNALNRIIFSDVLPGIENSGRLAPFRRAAFKIGEETFYEEFAYTCDPQFLEIFSPEIILGEKEDLLSVSNSAILTQSTSLRFFGAENPVGKTFSLLHQFDVNPSLYTVVAVIKDFPENSHLKISVLTSFEDPLSFEGTAWAYLKLQAGTDPMEYEKEIKTFIDSNFEPSLTKGLHPRLQALTDIHLKSHKAREIQPNVWFRTVLVLIITGMLVFLLAWFNFTLLSFGQNQMQIRRLMIQWQMGAGKSIFFRQFLVDNLFVGIIAYVLGILLTLLLSSYIDRLGNTASSQNFGILLFSILLLLILIVLGAIITASISTKLLYKRLQRRFFSTKVGAPPDTIGRSLFIRSIIGLEFIITFVLVSNLIMVAKQTRFAMNMQLGAEQSEAIHLHSLHRAIVDKFDLFKERMMENPNVVMVTGSMEEPTGQAMDACEFEIDGIDEGEKQLFLFPVDQNFLRFYDIDLLYGTDIPEEYNPEDSAEFFFLNETAAKMISDNPESLIGKKLTLQFAYPGFIWPGPITGIVEDFHLSGMDYEISPMVIFPKYTWLFCFSIKHGDNAEPVIKHMEEVWEELFPDYPLEYHYSSSLIEQLYQSELDQIRILMVFCIISIIIAGMGLFALSGLFMLKKVKSAALHKIKGARMHQIILPELMHYLWLAILSSAISLPASLLLMERWLRNFIYRAELPIWIFPLCTLILIIFSWMAVLYHAIRLARINPGEFIKEQ
jgi:putative ABC transport system permease protein